MSHDYSKLPRLYRDADLGAGLSLTLDEGPAHYFRTVLRRQEGDSFRVFNGRDGEFIATITGLGKKTGNATITEKIKAQPPKKPPLHLFFAPIKKQRMDFLVEKAVELGATALHPVLTDRCEIRKINEERLRAQLIESAEQCERMDIPALHPLRDLKDLLSAPLPSAPLLWCAERRNAAPAAAFAGKMTGFLIGPEGGFTAAESEKLARTPGVEPVSLGDTILRSETAALLCMALAAAGA